MQTVNTHTPHILPEHDNLLRELIATGIPEAKRFLDPRLPIPGTVNDAATLAVDAILNLPIQSIIAALKGREFVLDLDDTLATNIALFDRARWYMTAIYAEAQGREDLLDVMREREAVCVELLPELGYTPERWRRATMLHLERVAPHASDELRDRLNVASEIALGVGEFFAGVEATLDILHRAGVPLYLLTKGEVEKQQEKIAAYRLHRWFDDCKIVPHKDAAILRDVVEEWGLNNPIVVGDSAASDIGPALENGYDCVHIDHGHGVTWAAEHHDAGLAHERKSGSFAEAVLDIVTNPF